MVKYAHYINNTPHAKGCFKTIVSVNVWGVGWEERGGGGERWEEEYKVTFDYDIDWLILVNLPPNQTAALEEC